MEALDLTFVEPFLRKALSCLSSFKAGDQHSITAIKSSEIGMQRLTGSEKEKCVSIL